MRDQLVNSEEQEYQPESQGGKPSIHSLIERLKYYDGIDNKIEVIDSQSAEYYQLAFKNLEKEILDEEVNSGIVGHLALDELFDFMLSSKSISDKLYPYLTDRQKRQYVDISNQYADILKSIPKRTIDRLKLGSDFIFRWNSEALLIIESKENSQGFDVKVKQKILELKDGSKLVLNMLENKGYTLELLKDGEKQDLLKFDISANNRDFRFNKMEIFFDQIAPSDFFQTWLYFENRNLLGNYYFKFEVDHKLEVKKSETQIAIVFRPIVNPAQSELSTKQYKLSLKDCQQIRIHRGNQQSQDHKISQDEEFLLNPYQLPNKDDILAGVRDGLKEDFPEKFLKTLEKIKDLTLKRDLVQSLSAKEVSDICKKVEVDESKALGNLLFDQMVADKDISEKFLSSFSKNTQTEYQSRVTAYAMSLKKIPNNVLSLFKIDEADFENSWNTKASLTLEIENKAGNKTVKIQQKTLKLKDGRELVLKIYPGNREFSISLERDNKKLNLLRFHFPINLAYFEKTNLCRASYSNNNQNKKFSEYYVNNNLGIYLPLEIFKEESSGGILHLPSPDQVTNKTLKEVKLVTPEDYILSSSSELSKSKDDEKIDQGQGAIAEVLKAIDRSQSDREKILTLTEVKADEVKADRIVKKDHIAFQADMVFSQPQDSALQNSALPSDSSLRQLCDQVEQSHVISDTERVPSGSIRKGCFEGLLSRVFARNSRR